jgi:CubicO group peptidase (beta-lactamase class C family)
MGRFSGVEIYGTVSARFQPVRDVFAENFSSRDELGAACCVYHQGENVADLWGGIRNAATGEPWEEDTMVLVFSATKGLAAMVMALAHSRGRIDYEERVCTYWPEFAQNGKEKITVRQLLSHQAGLFAIPEVAARRLVQDLDELAVVLARQKPAWAPGERQAYHAITLGYYEGELIRRTDPEHRTLGQIFQEEIASPLELDLYIRLPEAIPNNRLAVLESPSLWSRLTDMPLPLVLAAFNPHSNLRRAMIGTNLAPDHERIYARELEVPSGGGVGTARGIARAYGVFANDGHELGLCAETLDALKARAVPPKRGFYDECLKGEAQFSLGFMKPNAAWPFGSSAAFGAPGAGGSLGFADPETGVGYAYVTNRMRMKITGDPREVALRNAVLSSLKGKA